MKKRIRFIIKTKQRETEKCKKDRASRMYGQIDKKSFVTGKNDSQLN